ncbi:hypothetical protein VCUG_00605 [Vavraia culicis subsp. floridensis]|uniref:Uncharacterized protein n=1 Tax=Vavraia culicis (isolate floridensis) TaxID=948595 RepID=L2GXT0_VAVCU|nr:uncharacterized protein VCUG_00605 [Vavraia culicis subsp. floridensis]ELA47885.1 hypothetical protein VCUG_00605 [Vavraia culicis subsp. floridensis]
MIVTVTKKDPFYRKIMLVLAVLIGGLVLFSAFYMIWRIESKRKKNNIYDKNNTGKTANNAQRTTDNGKNATYKPSSGIYMKRSVHMSKEKNDNGMLGDTNKLSRSTSNGTEKVNDDEKEMSEHSEDVLTCKKGTTRDPKKENETCERILPNTGDETETQDKIPNILACKENKGAVKQRDKSHVNTHRKMRMYNGIIMNGSNFEETPNQDEENGRYCHAPAELRIINNDMNNGSTPETCGDSISSRVFYGVAQTDVNCNGEEAQQGVGTCDAGSKPHDNFHLVLPHKKCQEQACFPIDMRNDSFNDNCSSNELQITSCDQSCSKCPETGQNGYFNGYTRYGVVLNTNPSFAEHKRCAHPNAIADVGNRSGKQGEKSNVEDTGFRLPEPTPSFSEISLKDRMKQDVQTVNVKASCLEQFNPQQCLPNLQKECESRNCIAEQA